MRWFELEQVCYHETEVADLASTNVTALSWDGSGGVRLSFFVGTSQFLRSQSCQILPFASWLDRNSEDSRLVKSIPENLKRQAVPLCQVDLAEKRILNPYRRPT